MKRIKTRTLVLDRQSPDPAILEEAAAILRGGGLVVFPTETVYGLGGDATNPEAVARIFEAKGRPATNPLIVHGASIADVRSSVAEWPRSAETLARRYWPGPLTLVLPRSRTIPDIVTAGRDTVGVRVPDSLIARELLRRAGRPIAAPSANRSTGVSPSTAAHVLKDLDGRVPLILDGGPTPIGIESTVLDLTTAIPRLLRPGAIAADQIGRLLQTEIDGSRSVVVDDAASQSSPGQRLVHYSPHTPLLVVEPGQMPTGLFSPTGSLFPPRGLIVAGHDVPIIADVFARRIDWLDPATAARELYATLHLWDDGSLHVIHVVLPPDVDAWRAVRDRLWRASRRWASASD